MKEKHHFTCLHPQGSKQWKETSKPSILLRSQWFWDDESQERNVSTYPSPASILPPGRCIHYLFTKQWQSGRCHVPQHWPLFWKVFSGVVGLSQVALLCPPMVISISAPITQTRFVFLLSPISEQLVCWNCFLSSYIVCLAGMQRTLFFLTNESREWSKLFTWGGKEWVNHGSLGLSMICYSNDLKTRKCLSN